jgi:hypothetical protein
MKSLNAETQGTQRKIKKIGGRKRREQQQKGQEDGRCRHKESFSTANTECTAKSGKRKPTDRNLTP